MTIRVEGGTRPDRHLCMDCTYSFRMGGERESEDKHLCMLIEEAPIEITKRVTECNKFDRQKVMMGLPFNALPVWIIHKSDNGTPVFLAPGEGNMGYSALRQYLNDKAAQNNALYGSVQPLAGKTYDANSAAISRISGCDRD